MVGILGSFSLLPPFPFFFHKPFQEYTKSANCLDPDLIRSDILLQNVKTKVVI